MVRIVPYCDAAMSIIKLLQLKIIIEQMYNLMTLFHSSAVVVVNIF